MKHIQQCGMGGCDEGHLGSEAQVENHDHEQKGPERRYREAGNGGWVDDIGQTGSCLNENIIVLT